jgi:hypothetical protein
MIENKTDTSLGPYVSGCKPLQFSVDMGDV